MIAALQMRRSLALAVAASWFVVLPARGRRAIHARPACAAVGRGGRRDSLFGFGDGRVCHPEGAIACASPFRRGDAQVPRAGAAGRRTRRANAAGLAVLRWDRRQDSRGRSCHESAVGRQSAVNCCRRAQRRRVVLQSAGPPHGTRAGTAPCARPATALPSWASCRPSRSQSAKNGRPRVGPDRC